jgi:hypothetical protein
MFISIYIKAHDGIETHVLAGTPENPATLMASQLPPLKS